MDFLPTKDNAPIPIQAPDGGQLIEQQSHASMINDGGLGPLFLDPT